MASKRPLQLLQRPSIPNLQQPHCARCLPTQTRLFSSTPTHLYTPELDESPPQPRWMSTPKAMVAPVRIKPLTPNTYFRTNSDPRKLDTMYNQFLGPGGASLLSDETKWLAVTHKSFDHGRRGFNDRLTFLGKRIVDLQASLVLMKMKSTRQADGKDEPFGHAALEGLENVVKKRREDLLEYHKVANVGKKYGLHVVTRWKPRQVDNMGESGEDSVVSGSVYAIIGALSLERGGEVANNVAREKVLKPLGLRAKDE